MIRRFETTSADRSPAVLVRHEDGGLAGVCFATTHEWATIIATALNAREGDRRAIAAELASAINQTEHQP